MKVRVNILLLSVMMVVLLTGCQSKEDEDIEMKMKSIEQQQEMLDTFTYDDYKVFYDEIIAEAEKHVGEDELLKKWMIRTLGMGVFYYETDLTTEQALQLSKQAVQEYEAWKSIALNNYGITVDEAEIDQYIEEGPDTSMDLPAQTAFADALGITVKELNHTFDRDFYEKYVIWQKLTPLLKEKYNTENNDELVEKYEKEVKKSVR